ISPTFKEIKSMLEKSSILNQTNVKPVPPKQSNINPVTLKQTNVTPKPSAKVEEPLILNQPDVTPMPSKQPTEPPPAIKNEPPILEESPVINETDIKTEFSPKLVESPTLNKMKSTPSKTEQEMSILNEKEIKNIDYNDENKDVPRILSQPEENKNITPKPTLLQKIKRKHKQESDLLRKKEENKPEIIMAIEEPKKPIKKLKKKELLSQIKKKHKKEREAASPKIP
ncbi:hypothetical protein GWI33_009402, partial [Rhynchophorus ferrugineus]